MRESEVTELVIVLSAAFPRPPMTEATCNVYERMLCDLDRDAAHRAVERLIKTAKWLPTVAEIRAAAVEIDAGPRRLGGEAWGDVGMAVRAFGRYREPEFTDPLVAECVRQMGWQNICNSTHEPSDRARFVELYDGMATRNRADLVAGPGLALPRAPGTKPGVMLPASVWTPLRGAEEESGLAQKKLEAIASLAAFDAPKTKPETDEDYMARRRREKLERELGYRPIQAKSAQSDEEFLARFGGAQ